MDEMAGIVIIAASVIVALLAVAPRLLGALSPLGMWLQIQTGHGGLMAAAFLMLVGVEAFIPHQALGVPVLALAFGLMFVFLEGLADLMGGQGGRIGGFIGGSLRLGLGVAGAWVVTVTACIIITQWITRVSMRGPARMLVHPLRFGWRILCLLATLARLACTYVPRVLGRLVSRRKKQSFEAPVASVAKAEDFVAPPSVVSGGKKEKSCGRAETQDTKSEVTPGAFADFLPLVGASLPKALSDSGAPHKPIPDDDDPEIPGYEDEDVLRASQSPEAPADFPVHEERKPASEQEPLRLAAVDDLNLTHEELTRAWAEQESPGAQQLSLPLPGELNSKRRTVAYRLPPLDLLNSGSISAGTESMDFSRLIVDTLNSFGVATRIINVEKGPTVTRYELQPARGVKVSKITSLNNDIALALAAQSIRIEAPIPGKSAIGIEVPNSRVDAVPMREIIESSAFQNGQGCMLALGKDISGRSVVTDLLRMPHLLIAGATGSGKSVCLNTVIVSMLYRFTPEQIQMVMVDPKRVELSIFEGIPHLANTNANPAQRIVKDAKTGTLVLKQATEIMSQRFELLSQSRVRNIAEYNAKSVNAPMPHLVIIVDELAQLMQISARSVEGYLQELAQMGRAAGIHLILATQRPSVDVLTGTIKSNFPARIAFAVSAQVDSRTILDRGGAEKLLGRGDMLFSPTDADLRRVQGCLITLEETERVVDFWRQQDAPDNLAQLSLESKTTDELLGGSCQDGEDEDLLREALRVIKDTRLASASNLQRKLQIGYPRAARLVDELEQRGFLGPANGSKPRKILFLEAVE